MCGGRYMIRSYMARTSSRVINSRDLRLANLLGALATGLNDASQEAAGAAAGLDGAAQAALVALIAFLPGGSVKDLSQVVGLTHSGAVRLVDRLVAAGLVARGAGRDARSRSVTLTAAGRRAALRIRAARSAAMAHTIDGLTADERVTCTELCERLIAVITRERLEQRAVNRAPLGGALCRMCDFAACGRAIGTCPAAQAAATFTASARSG
jgi:MarR family transcriptional regulator, negative regulator of the multidrug operon emrRAB